MLLSELRLRAMRAEKDVRGAGEGTSRVATSKLTLPVLRLLLSEKTDRIPRTKSEIVIALSWFQVFDVDADHLARLQRKARSAS